MRSPDWLRFSLSLNREASTALCRQFDYVQVRSSRINSQISVKPGLSDPLLDV